MADGAHIDELLDNAAWVRRLARRMLADQGLAEDVAQETWIAGLRAGPRGAELRPWLARVVRNFALQARRSERARSSREQAVARREPSPSSSETLERAELHARLVQAVLGLEEPFRTTILWRYFEELADDEIARRAGIDVATVRSRVARARAKLRDDLTRRGGPPERWLAALLPLDATRLAPIAAGTVIGGTGAIVMSIKLVGATAAAVALAAALWWAWPAERGSLSEPAAPLAETGRPALDVADPSRSGGTAGESARSAADVAPAPADAAIAAPPASLRGVVLDEDGRVPLAGARVVHRKGSELARSGVAAVSTDVATESDADGRFEIEAPRDADVGLWFERDGYFPLKISPSDLPRDPKAAVEAVLAPLGRIELALVDENGAPVAGAPITYSIDLGRGSQDQRWAHRGNVRAGTTGSDGRLTIAGLPCGMPIALRGARTSDDDWLGVATIGLRERVLAYEARLPSKPKVRGRLVRGATPVARANVTWEPFPLGYRDAVRASADDDGRFELAGLRPGKAEVQFGPPGTTPRVVTLAAGETLELGDLELPEFVAIGGRLVSRVDPLDGEYVVNAFRGGRLLASLPVREGSFQGALTSGALELLVTRGGSWSQELGRDDVAARVTLAEPRTGLEIDVEAGRGAIGLVLDGVPPGTELGVQWRIYAADSPWPVASGSAARDDDGRVRIGPLVPGRVRARVWIQGVGAAITPELAVVASQVTDAGRLTLGRTTLAVRVVDGAGRPVSRASVRARRPLGEVEAATGDDGRARLEGLEPGHNQLRVEHGDLGRVARDVVVESDDAREHVVELRGFVVIEGTLTSGGLPVPSTSVNLQPHGSNDAYNASTDALGRFRLEGLPAGRLRLWVHEALMTSVDVEAGETRRLDLEIGERREVRFVRDGAALDGLFSVAAIGADPDALAARRWTMGQEQDTTAILAVPAGRVLYCVSCAATGSQQSFVAVGDGADATVTMPRGAVTIATNGAWNGPLPRARLVELDGQPVIGMWGRPIELALDVDGEGRARVPCLPPNARVEVRGIDSRGAPFTADATTDRDGRAEVRWP